MGLVEGPVSCKERSTLQVKKVTGFYPVGARNSAVLCDLRIFMDQAAEAISSDDLDVGLDGVGKSA